jgi:hypothetical protein
MHIESGICKDGGAAGEPGEDEAAAFPPFGNELDAKSTNEMKWRWKVVLIIQGS